MACIGKIILAIVILQVAIVLAKPYEPYDDGLYHSNEDVEDYVYKRTESTYCNTSFMPRYHGVNKCRSSCRPGELDRHVPDLDYLCNGKKCCACRYKCDE